MDLVILKNGQMTRATPELAHPLSQLPHQRDDISALDRYNVHRCPKRWHWARTRDMPTMIRYLDHLIPRPQVHAEIVGWRYVVSQSIIPSGNFTELNHTVTCMVLQTNDRRTSSPFHDEFRGPRYDYVSQGLLSTLALTCQDEREQREMQIRVQMFIVAE
ncbi:hypothetical protein TNCV_4270851 [Trichonephila clavipes]|nr:hypothetical protein TNCV_4270851 [Trichonephila clavipes]